MSVSADFNCICVFKLFPHSEYCVLQIQNLLTVLFSLCFHGTQSRCYLGM